eukprot:scaffold1331_cov58-Phaeocystis_antarctica.AAC.3
MCDGRTGARRCIASQSSLPRAADSRSPIPPSVAKASARIHSLPLVPPSTELLAAARRLPYFLAAASAASGSPAPAPAPAAATAEARGALQSEPTRGASRSRVARAGGRRPARGRRAPSAARPRGRAWAPGRPRR